MPLKIERKPLPSTKVKFQCSCGKRLLIQVSQAGKRQSCTHCKKELILPTYQDTCVIGLYCECSTALSEESEVCPSCKKICFEGPSVSQMSVEPVAKIREIQASAKKEAPVVSSKKRASRSTGTLQITPLHLALAISLPMVFMGVVAVLFLYFKNNATNSSSETTVLSKAEISEKEQDVPSNPPARSPEISEVKAKDSQKEPEKIAETSSSENAMTKNDPMDSSMMSMVEMNAEVKELDPNFFKVHIAPIMAKTCATAECHGGTGKTGKFKLRTADALGQFSEADLQTNFERIQPFIKPGSPRESRLFLKPLAEDLGGLEHGGGDILTAGSPRLHAFEKFISGEKLENLPPTAIAGSDQEVELGQVVILDGNKSHDPNQDVLTFQWKFVSVPELSRCEITNADKMKSAFTPKVVGEYFVQLVVTDAHQAVSVPDKIKVTVFSKAEVVAIEESKKQQEAGFSPEQVQHRRYLRKIFFDTLNRSPSNAEYSRFQNQSAEQVIDQILASYEFWENWYEDELFYFLLIDNFRPANEALLSLPERLHKKQLNTREAIQAIVISQYFNARNPGNDTWVTVVFEQLLGMKVQDKKNVKHLVTGKKMYDGYKEKLFNQEGKSQADIVYITLNQELFYELYILRHYERYFGEKPKKEVLLSEIEQYKTNPACYPTLVKQWLLSQKYRDSVEKLRPKTDFKFVRAVYMDLLGRRPTFDEYRLLRNALQALSDSRPLRTILVKIIIESGQVSLPEKNAIANPRQWIREQFFRYLCRFPTEQELSVWSSTFPQRFCSPKLMVEALLLNREYNSY